MPSLSEIIYTCAIIACIPEDEPPPALMTISDIYETLELVAADAPYIDDKQAIMASNEREIDELQAEVKELEKRLDGALHTLSSMEGRKASEEVEKESKGVKNARNNFDSNSDYNDSFSGPNTGGSERSLSVEATFYTAFCSTGCTGITATGIDVRHSIYHEGKRVIAVDPNVIPLRSIVKVSLGNGQTFEAIAADTGGSIKGNRIDILVADRAEAYRLGRQKATVEILRKGER